MQIALLEGKNLIFSNSYSYQTSQDFIYHVLLVYNQFNLEPNDIPIHVSGQVIKDSEIFRMLYRYIRRTEIIAAPPTFVFGKKYEKIPDHFYFDLYSLKLCGS